MRFVAAVLTACALAVACGSEGGGSGFGRRAVELVEAMDSGRFDDVREALHPRLKGALTEERLGKAWDDFVRDHGELSEIGPPDVEEDNGTLVTMRLDMTKVDGLAQIRFLPSGEVVGLDFGESE